MVAVAKVSKALAGLPERWHWRLKKKADHALVSNPRNGVILRCVYLLMATSFSEQHVIVLAIFLFQRAPKMDPTKSPKKVLKLEFLGKFMGLGGVHLADR